MNIGLTPQTAARTACRVVSELFDRGIRALDTMLPSTWGARRVDRPLRDDAGYDAVTSLAEPGGSTSEVAVMVEPAVSR